MTKVAPNTQSLCVAASGIEVSFITLKLEVAKDMSLRALVDCGASNDFVLRQSLGDSKLTFYEREIPSNENDGTPCYWRIRNSDETCSRASLYTERSPIR